jgi:hypothetical protein
MCKNMLLSFDGQEMALVVNEKHVVLFQANKWRCVSKKKEGRAWMANRCH